MFMFKVKATQAFKHAGKRIEAGEVFEVAPADLESLTAKGYVEEEAPAPKKKKRTTKSEKA